MYICFNVNKQYECHMGSVLFLWPELGFKGSYSVERFKLPTSMKTGMYGVIVEHLHF